MVDRASLWGSAAKKCAQCGKRFYSDDYLRYTYKMQHKGTIRYFCGWNCQMRYERSIKKATWKRRPEAALPNQDIRRTAKEAGLKLNEVARLIGRNPGTFSQRLRKIELQDDEREELLALIRGTVK